MHVEKAMHVTVLYREMFTQEKIKLLQLTAGNSCLKAASPYKTGFRFFVLDKIEEFGFVFKGNLSNKHLKHPKLPKGILMDDDDDNDEDDDAATEDNNAGKEDEDDDDEDADDEDDDDDDEDDDIIDLTVESEDERVLKMCKVSK